MHTIEENWKKERKKFISQHVISWYANLQDRRGFRVKRGRQPSLLETNVKLHEYEYIQFQTKDSRMKERYTTSQTLENAEYTTKRRERGREGEGARRNIDIKE